MAQDRELHDRIEQKRLSREQRQQRRLRYAAQNLAHKRCTFALVGVGFGN